MAYLGTQGDEWDAQKDMALAGLGAAIAMTATLLVNRRCELDLSRMGRELCASSVALPLGEDRAGADGGRLTVLSLGSLSAGPAGRLQRGEEACGVCRPAERVGRLEVAP